MALGLLTILLIIPIPVVVVVEVVDLGAALEGFPAFPSEVAAPEVRTLTIHTTLNPEEEEEEALEPLLLRSIRSPVPPRQAGSCRLHLTIIPTTRNIRTLPSLTEREHPDHHQLPLSEDHRSLYAAAAAAANTI